MAFRVRNQNRRSELLAILRERPEALVSLANTRATLNRDNFGVDVEAEIPCPTGIEPLLPE